MKSKKIPAIRVGSKAVTLTEADGLYTFHCEILALSLDGDPVGEVDPNVSPKRVFAGLRRPDGSVVEQCPMGHGPGTWCRPWISSITVR